MADPSEARPALRRVLGPWSLLAVAAGVLVMQGTIVSVLQGSGIGGAAFLAALLFAFALSITYVLSFAELSLLLPRAGSISAYTEVALGHFPAIIAPIAGYLAPAIFGISAELLLVENVFRQVFPQAGGFPGLGPGLLAAMTVLNLLGIDVFARVQTALALAMLVALALIGIVGAGSGPEPLPDPATLLAAGSAGPGFLSLTVMAIWAFLGLEFVCPLIEECRNPRRDIPRAMLGTAVLLLGIYGLLVLAALRWVPGDRLASAPLPHLDLVLAIFGPPGRWLLLIVALTATLSTVNTVLAAVPRMFYGMAGNGQLPQLFRRLGRRSDSPWFGTLFVSVAIAIPTVLLRERPDAILQLLISAAAIWLVAYMLAHVDVIVLRRRYPAIARPFRTPWYPWPQWLGIAGMLWVFIHNSPSPELTLRIWINTGVVLLLAALYAAIWVRFRMRRGLFTPEALEQALRA